MHTTASNTLVPSLPRDTLRVGVVSTFPPTSCGIATFAAALGNGLMSHGAEVVVVRTDGSPAREHPLVAGSLLDDRSHVAAIAHLNATDLVIVQHEYGIYQGGEGRQVLELMERIEVPIVVVAHTVRTAPTPQQRDVLERVCELAASVVVMTDAGRDRLAAGYRVDPARVSVIPHGALTPSAAERRIRTARPPRILTWGLLGPGKGIEWAIDALDQLADLRPRPEYLVAGATHPKVRARSGEGYRQMLAQRAAASRSGVRVHFDDRYRDLAALNALIASADVIVLPYDSDDQVTSGVLVDAVAAGKPVVATAFPHATELLRSGAGIVVPQRDAGALGRALRSILTDPASASAMAAEARRLAPDLSWSAVADRYLRLSKQLVGDRQAVPT